jgi:hypothetical protein
MNVELLLVTEAAGQSQLVGGPLLIGKSDSLGLLLYLRELRISCENAVVCGFGSVWDQEGFLEAAELILRASALKVLAGDELFDHVFVVSSIFRVGDMLLHLMEQFRFQLVVSIF